MATRRKIALRKAVERALLARDRFEIQTIERLLAVTGGKPRVRIRARRVSRRPAR